MTGLPPQGGSGGGGGEGRSVQQRRRVTTISSFSSARMSFSSFCSTIWRTAEPDQAASQGQCQLQVRARRIHHRRCAGQAVRAPLAEGGQGAPHRAQCAAASASEGGENRELEKAERRQDDEVGADEVRRLRDRRDRAPRIKRVPFLDTNDLRYNLHVKRPVPTSQAVMFCLMDVSGSMDQQIKDMAKRFYLLLYMFLKRHYERTEIVFIRHHTVAKEVDEQEFFYSRETGGTVVSSALKLMAGSHRRTAIRRTSGTSTARRRRTATTGTTTRPSAGAAEEQLLPLVQYFAYVEITRAITRRCGVSTAGGAAQNSGDLRAAHIRK